MQPAASPLHILLPMSIALCLIVSPGALHAKDKKTQDRSAEAADSKKKGARKITYQRSSSEETTAERDRRMYRECKGLHNAGACRGYTR